MGDRPAALQADRRGLPAEPVRAPARGWPLGDSLRQEGGTGNDILAVAAYREFLTLYPSHPRSDYAQFQVARLLPAEERPRPRPDRDRGGPRRVPDGCSSSTRTRPRPRRPASASRSCGRAWPAPSSWPGYFYQRTRQSCRAAIARYEGDPERVPRLHGARRRPVPPGAMPVPVRDGSGGAAPPGASSRRTTRTEPARRRGRSSFRPAKRRSPAPARPIAGAVARGRRRPRRPLRPRRHRRPP